MADHKRRISAPRSLMMSWGSMAFPSDLCMVLPSASSTQPWVMTARYGAPPRALMPTSSEEWNQPRYWSPPSRYMSAGQRWPGRCCRMPCDEPDSNQTSRMSRPFSNSLPPQARQAVPAGTKSPASRLYQELEPSAANDFSTFSTAAGSSSASPQVLQKKAGRGTPQSRWREMHQSGRPAIMLAMRSWPQAGSQAAPWMASRALARSPAWSMAMNHWAVAR